MTDKFLRQLSPSEKTERVAGLELFIQINVSLGELELAEKKMQELREIILDINTPPFQAAWLHAQGVVAFGRGDYESSRNNLEDSVDTYERLLSPFEAARARVRLAMTLIRLQQRERAKSELNMAIQVFKKLGAKRDLEKSRQQLKGMETGEENDLGLSKREWDILRIVSAGKTNEQIADTLSISLRTVEKHLSNIYQKMGITGKSARAYAASFASKNILR
jgi:ATP/maltotriose-dependent transcriptional regulator MalT